MLPENSSVFLTDVVTIGAIVLKLLKKSDQSLDYILQELPSELGLAIDHIILTIDWLFALKAIKINDDEMVSIYNAGEV